MTMKKIQKIATVILIMCAAPAFAQSIPVENGAMISDSSDFPRARLMSLIDPGAAMIRAMGWRCDSISALRPFIMSRGFTMVCNNFNYTYNFSDEGGNWIVELD